MNFDDKEKDIYTQKIKYLKIYSFLSVLCSICAIFILFLKLGAFRYVLNLIFIVVAFVLISAQKRQGRTFLTKIARLAVFVAIVIMAVMFIFEVALSAVLKILF